MFPEQKMGLLLSIGYVFRSFHRVLKQVIMKGLKVIRIDKSINALMIYL